MDIQILPLQPPYDYIYCKGEVGKHIATYVVSEVTKDENGELKLETHSFPMVQYWNSPRGVVWNKAELTACVVLCNEKEKTVEVETLIQLAFINAEILIKEDPDFDTNEGPYNEVEKIKNKLTENGIKLICSNPDDKSITEWEVDAGKVSSGYYCDLYYYDYLLIKNFHTESYDDLILTVLETRDWWERLLDNLVSIHFNPITSFPIQDHFERL